MIGRYSFRGERGCYNGKEPAKMLCIKHQVEEQKETIHITVSNTYKKLAVAYS